MKKINHNELVDHVKKSYETQTSFFCIGGTGIGKSDMMLYAGLELAQEHNMELTTDIYDESKFRVIDFRIADKRPADLRGLPDLSGDRTVWKPPEFLPETGRGLIVLEEFNLADKSLQAPAYQLVLDRKLDGYDVPAGFGILALGNRRKDRASVKELGMPLKNRFDWAELKPPKTDEWVDWAFDNDIDSRVITFIKQNPQYLYKPPYEEDETGMGQSGETVKTFPTPRGWERVSDKIKGELDEEIMKYSSTTVGTEYAGQFESFVKLTQSYDIEHVINNPKTAELPNEPSAQYALSSAISQYFSEQDSKTQKVNFLDTVTKVADRFTPSFGGLLLRLTYKQDNKFVGRELPRVESFKNLSEDYLTFLGNRE